MQNQMHFLRWFIKNYIDFLCSSSMWTRGRTGIFHKRFAWLLLWRHIMRCFNSSSELSCDSITDEDDPHLIVSWWHGDYKYRIWYEINHRWTKTSRSKPCETNFLRKSSKIAWSSLLSHPARTFEFYQKAKPGVSWISLTALLLVNS